MESKTCLTVDHPIAVVKRMDAWTKENPTATDNNGVTDKNVAMKLVLKPVVISVKLFGLYFGESVPKNLRYIQRFLFALLLLAMAIVSITKYANLIITNRTFSSALVEDIVSSIWFSTSLISVIFMYYWQIAKKLESLCDLLSTATDQQGVTFFRAHLWKLQITFLIFSTIFFVFNIVVFTNEVFDLFDFQFSSATWKGMFFDYANLNIVTFVCCIYATFAWCLGLAMFCFTIYCVAVEYYFVNGQLRSENLPLELTTVQKYYETYQHLLKAVEYADGTFRIYIFLMLCGNIPLVILLMYSLFTVEATYYQYAVLTAWLLYTVLHLTVISVFPSIVNEITKEANRIFYKKLTAKQITDDQELFRLATWFSSKSIHEGIGISAWSFFEITKPLILTTVSLIITYLTLLIQFYPSVPNNNNATNSSRN